MSQELIDIKTTTVNQDQATNALVKAHAATKEEIRNWAANIETSKSQMETIINSQASHTTTIDTRLNDQQAIVEKLNKEKATHEDWSKAFYLQHDQEYGEVKLFMNQVKAHLTASSTGTQADAVQQLASGLVSSHNASQARLAALEQRMDNIQNAANNRGASQNKPDKAIMEYKGIIDMAVMDKDKYQEWREQIHDKIEQARPGFTKVLRFIERNASQEISEIDMSLQHFDISYEQVKMELMSILIDKTSGEARGKVKAVKDVRDGINAYRLMHEWFTKCSGLGLAERRMRVMKPNTAQNETQVIACIEAWEREVRELKEIIGKDPLDPEMMITAVSQIPVGGMKECIRRKYGRSQKQTS